MPHHSKGLIEENIMHLILNMECPDVMQVIAIICLFWIVFSNNLVKFFVRVHGLPTII